MAELLGRHSYQVDAKGRIALPVKFREAFADGVYLTLGEESCLYAFPRDEWERRRGELRAGGQARERARARSRMFFSNAEQVELDRQGRLVIPQRLRDRVRLGKEAVVIGLSEWLEIWPRQPWERYEEEHAGAYTAGALDPEDE